MAYPDERWHWKDEAEFARRLTTGIDSAEHQATVRTAGEEFIRRFQQHAPPFNQGWEQWQLPATWQARPLPPDWAIDWGTHAVLR